LRSFAAALWGTESKQRASANIAAENAKIPALNAGSDLPELRRMLIIGGKGGVGKTTVASSLALRLAEANPDRRFLLFSSDPAHSLSDSFAEPIGEFKAGVGGCSNLDAIEIDAVARFDQLKEKYRKWIEELFSAITGGSNWEVRFDREAMQELISLAPPGIDEIAALSAVSDLLEKGAYASVILDTAPTGHLLRFLELPEVALSWVRTFIRLLLKYREFVTSSDVAEELIALSRSIKRVIAILTDAEKCRFSAVAIPERMSLAETQRLAAGIETRQVRFAQVIVNNVIPDEAAGSCPFCRERRVNQEGEIEVFRKEFAKSGVLMEMPQFAHEIRGTEALREFAMTAWPPRRRASGVRRKKAGKSQ
jgi:arsenite-transporting ATPase